MPQLVLQPFRRFTHVTAHSPILPLLHLRHSSIFNPSFASPTSQTLHLLTWRAAHGGNGYKYHFKEQHVCLMKSHKSASPPLWDRWYHARLSRSGPGFDPWSGQVSWVRFFRGFSSPVGQMSERFRPQGPRISFGHHNHSLRASMTWDVDAP